MLPWGFTSAPWSNPPTVTLEVPSGHGDSVADPDLWSFRLLSPKGKAGKAWFLGAEMGFGKRPP